MTILWAYFASNIERTLEIGTKALIRQITESIQPLYGKEESDSISKLLLNHFCGISAIIILSNKVVEIDPIWLENIIERLKTYEPVQYIIGEVSFAECKIHVNSDVLIPRSETEELVHLILSENPDDNLKAIDCCTGSGCIAIAISKSRPGWKVSGLDISLPALKTAERNNLENRTSVKFYQLDILKYLPVETELDLIISNPPYVSLDEKDKINKNVIEYEPHLALFAPDADPLAFYRHLQIAAEKKLKSGGRVYFELNQSYAKEVYDLFENLNWSKKQIIKDLNGHPRFFKANKS